MNNLTKGYNWHPYCAYDRSECGVELGTEDDPHQAEVASLCLENITIDDPQKAWEYAVNDAYLLAASHDLLLAVKAVIRDLAGNGDVSLTTLDMLLTAEARTKPDPGHLLTECPACGQGFGKYYQPQACARCNKHGCERCLTDLSNGWRCSACV